MKITKNPKLFTLILIIVATTQLVYLNSLSNQFTYDDEFTIVNNHFIKTWNNLPLLFHKEYFMFSGELSYRPVVTLSYFLDYALWKLNPFGFHLTNALLHTLNSVLLFFLFMRFLNHRVASFMAVLIFSCHPVLTETVNAVSYREDLLGATFFIGAFLLYLKTRGERPLTPAYFASVVCYLLGVFSKEMAVTLPLFIFLYDIILTKKPNLSHKLIYSYPGYILVTVFYLVIRFVILHNPAESHVLYPGNSIFVNFLTMSRVLVSYIKLFFFPFSLCADYVIQDSYSFLDTSFILSFLLLSSVTIITYRMFFYSKIVFFSMIWFFISLLPVINIIPIENIMAERYLYLPILGFCMLAGSFFVYQYSDCGTLNKSYIIIFLTVLVLVIFSIRTIRRNNIWIDQIVLWTNTAKISPDSFKAHNNLGNIYRDAGRFDEAIVELKHAIALYDGYIDAHNNLGVTYRKKGMINEAVHEYQKALQINPRYPYAHNNLGVLYAKSNLLDLSIAEFKNAISSKPDYFDAHNNLGATYIRKGFYEKAIQECLEAIKYNNRYKDAYYNLSVAYFNSKQFDKALDTSKVVLSIDQDHQEAREIFNLICKEKGLTEKK